MHLDEFESLYKFTILKYKVMVNICLYYIVSYKKNLSKNLNWVIINLLEIRQN